MTKKTFVISLGGSLIADPYVNTNFVKRFRVFINNRIQKGDRFIIITGGGKVCREYQTGLKSIYADVTSADLDWMGIHVTRLNAHLLRLAFGKAAHPDIVDDPNVLVSFKEKILIAGGWKPGRSTDDDAVRLAHAYGSTTIINLSNVDYVYTKDPRKFKDAEKVERMTWKDYSKYFGVKWSPGLHAPFDPVAAKFAQKNKQTVIVADGEDLKNLENILNGKQFKGTIID